MKLSAEQLERYSRQMVIKDFGHSGQENILKSKILVIGAGGLGSPATLYLAAAGVGTLGIVDGDKVSLSNLHRQVLHYTSDLNKAKVSSAQEKINKLNPEVKVIPYQEMVTLKNILKIINDYDFILDCTDNFTAKFLINDACLKAQKPFSHGGILDFSGQTLTVIPLKTACYRCIFIKPPPEDILPLKSQRGVLGPAAGSIGIMQAIEALKFILNQGTLLTNRLLTFDALQSSFREIPVKKNKNCPACGEDSSVKNLLLSAEK